MVARRRRTAWAGGDRHFRVAPASVPMIGLGRILSEARDERAIPIEQAERETRISRRYLEALEAEDFAAFPTRTQARGFLRLYARYLLLDTTEILALFPQDALEEGDGLVSGDRIFRDRLRRTPVSWPDWKISRPAFVLPAAVLVVLFGSGLISARCASGHERLYAGLVRLSRDQLAAPVRVPDVRDRDLSSALALMNEAGVTPLVIEVTAARVPPGRVLSQAPAPGAVVLNGADVTLIVSRGPP